MLVLVVGPSGAGKDTLLAHARQALMDDPRVQFVRRVITRPAEAGHEDHEAVTEEEFGRRAYALQWQAHGLSYGIPDSAVRDLASGRVLVANVSRGVIAEAAERFPVRVVRITAPAATLAARLSERGRETGDAIAARLSRDVALPGGLSLTTIVNDRSPEEGAAQLVAVLQAAMAAA